MEGHTDSTGTIAANQQLSRNRAGSVSSYLQPNFHTAIRTRGWASERPVGDNRTREGREKTGGWKFIFTSVSNLQEDDLYLSLTPNQNLTYVLFTKRYEPDNEFPFQLLVDPDLLFIIFSGLLTVNQGYIGVVTMFGKYQRIVRPGLNFKIPLLEQMYRKVSIQNRSVELEFQAVTQDQANVYFKSMMLYSRAKCG